MEEANAIEVCPGFVLSQEASPAKEDAVSMEKHAVALVNVKGARFGTGRFWIETEPNLKYRIRVEVCTCM